MQAAAAPQPRYKSGKTMVNKSCAAPYAEALKTYWLFFFFPDLQHSSDSDTSSDSSSESEEDSDDDSADDDDDNDEPLSLAWPETRKKQAIYLFLFPIVFPLWSTMPDVRNPVRICFLLRLDSLTAL